MTTYNTELEHTGVFGRRGNLAGYAALQLVVLEIRALEEMLFGTCVQLHVLGASRSCSEQVLDSVVWLAHGPETAI